MKAKITELERSLGDLGTLLGCGCIWKRTAYCLTEYRLREHWMHTAAFCTRFKAEHGEKICIRHDTETMARRIISGGGKPFLLECPAGACEFVVPVAGLGRILGAVIVGPFKGVPPAAPELPCWRPELAPVLTRLTESQLGPRCREIYGSRPEISGSGRRILPVLDYLEANYPHPVTLTEAARRVYLSPSRLSHLFKSECGVSFSGYLTQLRLREAALLLAETLFPVGDVAGQCGFPNRNHFPTIFKKYYGVPPLRYRAAAVRGRVPPAVSLPGVEF